MSKDNPKTEDERVAWIQANYTANDALVLIASGKSAGQIAMDSLNGDGPMFVQKVKGNGSGAQTSAPASSWPETAAPTRM